MEFLEKHLEDIIWEAGNEKLKERGLPIEGKKLRQLRIGNYGVADIVTVKKRYFEGSNIPYLDITVYELKKDKIGIGAFLQAVNYVQGIKTYLDEYRGVQAVFNIVLCGREVDDSGGFIYLTDLIDSYEMVGSINNLMYYTYNYSIDGIVFKNKKFYNLVNHGF